MAAILFILGSALSVWNRYSQIGDLPWGCDLFGHLSVSKTFRDARANGVFVAPAIRSPQVDFLVNWFESKALPPSIWGEAIGPHAHHFNVGSKLMAAQYPPGTGFILSLFQEGRAYHDVLGLSLVGIVVFTGLTLFLVRARKAPLVLILTLLLALYLIEVLDSFPIGNYSIHVNLIPTLLTLVLFGGALLVSRQTSDQPRKMPAIGLWFAALAGVMTGLSSLIRIPFLLHVPGMLTLLPDWRRRFIFVFGLIGAGIIPLLIYQSSLTGGLFQPTYGSGDSALPNWKAIGPALRFYFTRGEGSHYFILPLVGLLTFKYLGGTFKSPIESMKSVDSKFLLGVLLTWGLPVAFFLTHSIFVSYYLIPSHIVLLGLLLIASLRSHDSLPSPEAAQSPALAFSLLAGMALWISTPNPATQLNRFSTEPFGSALTQIQFSKEAIPSDLKDPKTWIWADLSSGAFWYLIGKPGFKLSYGASPALRKELFLDLGRRGDRQFLVADGSGSFDLMKELKDLGVKLDARGTVFNHPYYELNFGRTLPQ